MKKSLFGRFYKEQEMDEVSNNIKEQTGSEVTWMSPPKQPRTDYTVTDDHFGKRKLDFPLLTFPISPPSPLSTLQKSVELMYATKYTSFQDENPLEQPQDAKLNVTPVTEATTSHFRMAHSGSPDEGFSTAERHSLALSENEQLPVTETDKSSYSPGDDAGGCSAPYSTDAPRHLTINQHGESLEEETPGGFSLSVGKEQDKRQVQSQAISCGAHSEEVTRQSDCTQKDNHTNASSEVSGADQKRDELETSDTSLIEKEDKSHKALSEHNYTKLWQNSEEKTNGNSAQAEKHAQIGFQIPEEESVSVCNLEIKSQVNETDWRENILLSAAEYAEESILACDVVSDRNTAKENVCFEVDEVCGAKEASAAGKIIAEAPSEKADHMTDTATPAGISQGRAEGDNDAVAFGVIDPAIWSETDRDGEEKRCNSESSAGGGLSSVNVHETEAPCSDVRLSSPDGSGQFNHQSTTWQNEDEDFCQAHSMVTNKPQNTANSESSCQWKFSSSPPESLTAPPAGDYMKLGSCDAGHELKEQSASSCLPGGLTLPQVEISQCENDETAEIKEHGESFVAVTKSDEPQSSESETHEQDRKIKLVEEEQGNKLKCFSDLSLMMDVTSGEEGRKDHMETGVHGDSERLENSDVKHEDKHTKAQWSPGEETETKTVTLCNESDQEYDCQLSDDIKKKLLAFTSFPGSDALVPCQRDFNHSQNANHTSSALNPIRFSPLMSAFALHSDTLGGFGTFQKIPLSQSDDDDDDKIVGLEDLARVPILSSSPHQMSEAQPQLHEGAESKHAGLVCSVSSPDQRSNFISGADLIAVKPPCCELINDSLDSWQHSDSFAIPTGSEAPSPDVNVYPEFDMKTQFDTVLKELQLFFDISRNELAEFCGDTSKATVHQHPSSPELEQHRDTSSEDVNEDRSLEICGGRATVRVDGEQEVPRSSHLRQEVAEDCEDPCRERLETQQKRKTWSPSFGFEPLLEQLNHRLLEPPRRLAPLKTCTGPRRVGLSKRARTKPLHRPRPFK